MAQSLAKQNPKIRFFAPLSGISMIIIEMQNELQLSI